MARIGQLARWMPQAKNPEVPSSTAAPPRRRRRIALAVAVTLAALVWGADRHVAGAAEPWIVASEAAPQAMCILVPGARVYDDGSPCSMLVDRLAAAAALHAAGAAPFVVVSGRGGGSPGEDEVGAMRRWLLARGVPAEQVLDDPMGLRTIDSLRNCRDALGMSSALVVSNDFHVPRMVFLGRSFGIEVHGVEAPALVDYSTSVRWRNRGREVLARLRACVDVYL